MDSEIEDKIIQLQICIDQGHHYEMDKETFDGESVFLNCTICEYSKKMEVTKAQATQLDKLFDNEAALEGAILKNKESD